MKKLKLENDQLKMLIKVDQERNYDDKRRQSTSFQDRVKAIKSVRQDTRLHSSINTSAKLTKQISLKKVIKVQNDIGGHSSE